MTASKTTKAANSVIEVCQSISSFVEDRVHNSSKLFRGAEIKSIDSHIESISSTLEQTKPYPKLNPAKRELKKTLKTLSSLRDGLDDEAFNAGEYRSYLDSTLSDSVALAFSHSSDVVEKLRDSVEQENPLVHIKDVSSKNGDMSPKEVLAKFRDEYKKVFTENEESDSASGSGLTLDARNEALEDAEAKKELSSYKRFRSKLPRNVKIFDVAEVPVVPIFKDFNLTSEKVLNKTGIRYNKLGQHLTVFENQIVMAFNRKTITKGRNTPKSRQAQTRLYSEYDKHVYEIVDLLNERSSIKYTVVSKKYLVSPSNKNIMFVWLMPAAQLARLRQSAATSKGLELEHWGFPWSV